MADFDITDEQGRTLTFNSKGDTAPSEKEISSAFAQQFPEDKGAQDIQRAEARTQARGGIDLPGIQQKLTSPGIASKLVGGLQAAGVPFQIAEAVIANPLLEARQGDFREIPSSILEGLKGKRLGEFGDVLTSLGASETQAKLGGLGIDMVVGGAVIEQGFKALRKGIVKGSDKVALAGTRDLIQGADRATDASKAVTNQFWSQIDKVSVNSAKFLDVLDELPDAASKIIQLELGKSVDELAAQGLTLADVRTVKQIIGAMKPSAFGKDLRGASELLSDKRINRAYAKTSKFIADTLVENKLGDKVGELMNVNDAAEDVINAVKVVKGSLVPARGGVATEAAISKVTQPAGASFRESLKKLSSAGGRKAQKSIEKGLVKLRTLSSKRAFKQAVASSGKAVATAGLISAAFNVANPRR
jgi:hypothetical protein